MANKKLPGGRKSAGRVSTSAQKLVALKAGATGIAISELPEAVKLTGVERFPVVQDKETRGATVEQIKELIPTGETGASAYEVWSASQPEGADKSEAAFLAYIVGKPGKDGENGNDGLSAYQIWADAQGEGVDTSESAYLAFQEGKTGENGKSSYQLWIEEGYEGTEADYLEWQRASVSIDGIEPVKGAVILSAKTVQVIANSDKTITPVLNKFINLDYYIVANSCTVTIDLSSWDASFHERQNLRFSAFANGTGYITFIAPDGGNMYRLDGELAKPEIITVKRTPVIFQVIQDPLGSYLRVNKIGPIATGAAGASAYDIWAGAQDVGADTSEAAYLESMEGKPGIDGRSAYQVWLDAGNEGSEDDFLEWLRVSASVEVDPLATNLIKQNADGLYANGAHPVIPKFASSTLNGLLDTFKSMLDGTRVYTMTSSITNPLKISQLGGVSIQRYISVEPQYYFTNENGEYIPAQYFVTGTDITASTIKVTVSVVMSSKPQRSWDLSTLESIANADDGTLQCKVAIKVLAGTSLSQNGMS